MTGATTISPSGAAYEVFSTAEAAAREAAEGFAAAARETFEFAPMFCVALPGGSSPIPMFERLASDELRGRVDWSRVEIFFGDERAVGPDRADSNYRSAREHLLDRVPIDPARVHRMEGEARDLDEAAARYEAILREKLPRDERGVGVFDLVVLGLGADGHTASLFPGTAALDETERWVVANDVPQLKTRRLTLTYPILNAARRVVFLAPGAAKADRVAEILGFAPGGERHPAARVRPKAGESIWLLDEESAKRIRERD